jgi:hypothetical protein
LKSPVTGKLNTMFMVGSRGNVYTEKQRIYTFYELLKDLKSSLSGELAIGIKRFFATLRFAQNDNYLGSKNL